MTIITRGRSFYVCSQGERLTKRVNTKYPNVPTSLYIVVLDTLVHTTTVGLHSNWNNPGPHPVRLHEPQFTAGKK